MCGVDWCGFTWQAFSTLVTGFAAVGGATFIGLRQHGLIREQARIADRQAATAESAASTAKLKLRADLFDKRLSIYLGLKGYLKAALSRDPDATVGLFAELHDHLERARFLFSTEVISQLDESITLADELGDTIFDRDELKATQSDVSGLNAQIRAMRRTLRGRIANLAETLGDEMKLYG